MRFRVQLQNTFHGPLDLLLYLVQKQELDVTQLSIASVTDQFLETLALLEQLDVNAAGDFLELASRLIEMKSRLVLPNSDEVEEALDDPRNELVHRLLEFKQYRDAACLLEQRRRVWCDRYARLANELPPRPNDLAQQPIQEVELWDLVSAFGRILGSQLAPEKPAENIRYDDTPIHVTMERVDAMLRQSGQLAFHELFDRLMLTYNTKQPSETSLDRKSILVGMFLAVLELIRHRHALASQPELFGQIWLQPGPHPLPSEMGAMAS